MQEEWANINGYEGLYLISNIGKVLSLTTKKIRITNLNKRGYEQVSLCRDGKIQTHRIHRLVAIAFIPNPERKEQVNHIDGVKTNNCVTNLEWNTNQENKIHAVKNGLTTKKYSLPSIQGSKHGRSKLNEKDVLIIRELSLNDNFSNSKLGKMFNVSSVLISLIVQRKRWTHI